MWEWGIFYVMEIIRKGRPWKNKYHLFLCKTRKYGFHETIKKSQLQLLIK